MAAVYKGPNILYLPGLQAKDLDDDDGIFDDRFTENIASVDADGAESHTTFMQIHYNEIPSTFTCMQSWIKSTNLLCWHCDRSVKSIPWFVPNEIYSDKEGKRVIEPFGNFDKVNCVQAFINDHYHGTQHDMLTKNLLMLYETFMNRRVPLIKPSPPRTIMKKYCGDSGITSEEYEKMIVEINSDYSLGQYKMEHFKPQKQEAK
jgi:hypothetical protein